MCFEFGVNKGEVTVHFLTLVFPLCLSCPPLDRSVSALLSPRSLPSLLLHSPLFPAPHGHFSFAPIPLCAFALLLSPILSSISPPLLISLSPLLLLSPPSLLSPPVLLHSSLSPLSLLLSPPLSSPSWFVLVSPPVCQESCCCQAAERIYVCLESTKFAKP